MSSNSPKKLRRNRKLAAVAISVGLLSTTFYSIPTSASYSDSASATVNVASQTWMVSSLSVTSPSFNTASVQWTALPFYSSYNLQWSKSSDFSNPYSAVVNGSSYVASGLDELTNYYFRIQSVGAPANSGWSSSVSTRTPESPYSIKSPADIVAFDSRGELWNYGPAGSGTSSRKSIVPAGTAIPSNFYVTDWDSDGIQDLVLKTPEGNLNFWRGLPNGGFSISPISTGGWQNYDITVGKWKNTDTKPSVLAVEKSTGDMYVYPNDPELKLGSRTKVSSGWKGVPIQLLDFDRDGNADVLGNIQNVGNGNGEMQLFRTNGNGSFISETRKSLGPGWNSVNPVSIVYGAEGPGTVGIVARDVYSGNILYYTIADTVIGFRRDIGSGMSGLKMAGN